MEPRDQQWRNVLTTAALVLEGDMDDEKGTASGSLRGVQLRLELATRGSGSSTTQWTEVLASSTLPADVVVFLRPEAWADSFLVRRGLAVDVLSGDKTFDGAFLVEAAPAEVIRRVLDRDMRRRLLALHPLTVETCDDGLRLSRAGWEQGPNAIRQLLESAAILTNRIRAAFDELEAAERPRALAYRDQPKAPVNADRAAERARVQMVRARRDVFLSFVAIIGLGALVALVLLPWTCQKASSHSVVDD